ncbi:MAG: hypothetical protein ACO2PN_20570 [Pyrobaculum sp.]|jgi:hypothetical protein
MAAVRDIREVVADLLVKLEAEGVHGVRAWFNGRPNIVVVPDFDGWEVVFSCGRIMIKMTLDKDYNVTSVKVMYG